jgi:hypothetical protein
MTPNIKRDFTNTTPSSLRRSGGLQWHFRALRHWRLHDSFRRAVGAFLTGWSPPASHLIIIGSSAGWFLPKPFLLTFSRLTLVDLDTSAPFFFARRHGHGLERRGSTLEWWPTDFVHCLPRLLVDHPDAAILFCNVLGQLGLERDDYEKRLAELPVRLAGRTWASFHDRYSARIRRGQQMGTPCFTSQEPMDEGMLQRLGFGGEWTDHGTGGVLPAGVLRHYFPWYITPRRFHWIEAGAVT